ncbi:V-type ATP synthase subunit E [Arthrobacter sp. ATA002]|uniref:V-type ATP synthase subunit E n=1 Tax=Arthrobacter sp. ATA002 TaxID=2991715 RepID=UPI0022A6B6C8|nr:V-type ATP synthase subunit E [Arthrobacter sp. ATA002]WAP50826.1 V-type ATP synthase subunit E [Arthrobacter sp. ATA002]
MSRLPAGSDAALEPVRLALRREAETEAGRLAEDARRQAEALLSSARAEAEQIRATAAREGADAARTEAAGRSARIRREARRTVLARQEALRSELGRQVRDRARDLRSDPRYPQILRRLTERADAVLGPMASVTESYKGGVTAAAGSRHLDLSLPALAEQALERHAGEVHRLWDGA